MDFEDQEEHYEEMEMELSSDSLINNNNNNNGVGANNNLLKSAAAETVMTASAAVQLKSCRYRECLKNHAVGIGGHALDGCGEFLPAGADGTLDALKCAACNCHRNFHRKETDEPYGQLVPHLGHVTTGHHHHVHGFGHPQFSPTGGGYYSATPGGYLHVATRPTLALPSTSGGGGTDQEDDMSNPMMSGGFGTTSSKKRFRTKFSAEQKERMMELAVRLGWRIQKEDEAEVQSFCDETGVKRHVLKGDNNNNNNGVGANNNLLKSAAAETVMTASAAVQLKSCRYRECLKNHAVGIGGHALDGCGEFLPAGADGTLDALKCAACNCHRNFHRKETDEPYGQLVPHLGHVTTGHHHHVHGFGHPQFSPTGGGYYSATPGGYLHVATRPTLALPSTSGGGGTDQEDDMSNPMMSGGFGTTSSKKRFRTKFSAEQKERMMELAVRLGWRIQKEDEAEVQSFCDETGVKRHVLKGDNNNNNNGVGANNNLLKSAAAETVMTASAAVQLKSCRYRECLKNHAVGIGGHALDGCGEFLPAGADGTLDALKCAACNCHRNFHRKETDEPYGQLVPHLGHVTTGHHHHVHGFGHPQFSPTGGGYYSATPGGYLHVATRPTLALPSTSGGGGTDQEDDMSNPMMSGGFGTTSSKKRFRTKFSAEQKERMMELAVRLGWRIQKEDEAEVQSFCDETGVKRHVLKVWMHNNKHTLGKKP